MIELHKQLCLNYCVRFSGLTLDNSSFQVQILNLKKKGKSSRNENYINLLRLWPLELEIFEPLFSPIFTSHDMILCKFVTPIKFELRMETHPVRHTLRYNKM